MKKRKPNWLIRFLRPAHAWVYRLSGGRMGTKLLDMPVLLLRTIGKKSGRARLRALSYLRDQENYVLAASNGGADYHPDWWFNLQADPRAHIQVQRQYIEVYARQAIGEERDNLWKRFIDMEKRYGFYEKRTKRQIPVIILEPQEELA